MSLASSAFQNLENFVKLKISQASPQGAPVLIEELEDENAELDATNGQHEDESDEHEDTPEEVDAENEEHEQDDLKVGLDLNKDMENVNKRLDEDQPERNPDVEDFGNDVDVSLMNLDGEAVLDQQLMAPTAGRGLTKPSNRKMEYPETQQNLNHSENQGAEQSDTTIVDERTGLQQCEEWKASGTMGHLHEVSLLELDQRCIGHMEAAAGISHVEVTSEEASGSAGVPTRTSPAAPPPLLRHAPPQQWTNFGICVYATNFDKRKFDYRVPNFTGKPREMPPQTEKFGVMFGHCQNKIGK
jgi:hypothetical protein